MQTIDYSDYAKWSNFNWITLFVFFSFHNLTLTIFTAREHYLSKWTNFIYLLSCMNWTNDKTHSSRCPHLTLDFLVSKFYTHGRILYRDQQRCTPHCQSLLNHGQLSSQQVIMDREIKGFGDEITNYKFSGVCMSAFLHFSD